ncbi:hypothetical protein HYC85_014368 [Camellia sinensis]|uniref:Uncharacterized protein n=1 Tax=Camellia sinensis TaxID=4442 RepID=A0A7J7H833_CAMSI|nr:hypothetical protein HYC85_014368 [Camellia sinensis]
MPLSTPSSMPLPVVYVFILPSLISQPPPLYPFPYLSYLHRYIFLSVAILRILVSAAILRRKAVKSHSNQSAKSYVTVII